MLDGCPTWYILRTRQATSTSLLPLPLTCGTAGLPCLVYIDYSGKQQRLALPAGQSATFDSTLTMQMQLFGSSVLPFTSAKQTIVTDGIAQFLGTGVTGSQISLTVDTTIAGVSSLVTIW